MNQRNFPTGVVALIILTLLMLIGVGGLIFGVSPLGGVLFFSVVMIMLSVVVLFWMLNRPSQRYRDDAALRRARAQLATGKPKRGSSLAELMSVLSDEDLYDLRQHIKHRLMDQVDAGDDATVETFEALLADAETKRKRQ